MPRNRVCLFVIMMLAMTLRNADSTPDAPSFKQQEVMAVFLFNFAHFVSWPDSAFNSRTSSLRYCMMEDNPVAGPLREAIRGESIGNRRLELSLAKHVDGFRECHILFVSEPERDLFGQILADTYGRNVLTVSDVKDFTNLGGMISLTTVNKRLRPFVNKRALDATQLSVSSKLLRVAILSGM